MAHNTCCSTFRSLCRRIQITLTLSVGERKEAVQARALKGKRAAPRGPDGACVSTWHNDGLSEPMALLPAVGMIHVSERSPPLNEPRLTFMNAIQ